MAALADWFSQFWVWFVAFWPWFWTLFVAHRENIVSFLTLVGGAIGIYLLNIRTRAANRSSLAALEQANTAADRHNAQTDADRERRITESFANAVEQLGSDKLATRLGGIYTLERLARESEREYWPIMETLTAFVREHAPCPPCQSDEAADQEKEPKLSRNWPKTDVQAVLTVLGRREEEMRKREEKNQRLDLSATDLRGAKLSEAHLENAYLFDAHLEHTDFNGAHLEDADLWGAHLEYAWLGRAHLEGASLEKAHLKGVKLNETHLQGTRFSEAHFENGQHLQEQINKAFGDESTILPEGLERPAHWTER